MNGKILQNDSKNGTKERYWRASEQLVQQHPHTPVVHGPVVALVEDDLGGHVFGGAAERPRLVGGPYVLAEAV